MALLMGRYLDMGSYREWEEETRLAFLERELQSKRPLIPPSMPMSSSVKEACVHPALSNPCIVTANKAVADGTGSGHLPGSGGRGVCRPGRIRHLHGNTRV